jgi:peptidoglycan/xylan/chitin deacetylase (PgdA/CDA1 family)
VSAGRGFDAGFGALVLSLDFELHWGVRDHTAADGPYRRNLLAVWEVVPRTLELFAEFGVQGTWATVGMLFARDRAERERFSPAVRPTYARRELDPYLEATGEGEADDPLHYASSLVGRIVDAPGQEMATHTYSHFYCLEEGQSAEAFQADLRAAVEIAAERGVTLRSIVFPRNQHNPAYDSLLREAGITCYRSNARGWMYSARAADAHDPLTRASRLADAYLPLTGPQTQRWDEAATASGLVASRASLLLRPATPRRPALERLRLARLSRAMEHAAREREIFHLWWHPHNFGGDVEANLRFLRSFLERFARARDRYGMRSLTMSGLAEVVLGRRA